MNTNKRFARVSVPNAMLLLAAAACCCFEVSRRLSPGGRRMAHTRAGTPTVVRLEDLTGFGPEVAAVLPVHEGRSELLDLETGRRLALPDSELNKLSAEAFKAWIHTNGLDISGRVWPGGAACVTYNMRVVPVEARCWGQMLAEELMQNPALAPNQPAPRRLLVLGHGRTNTYLFRTGEGTLGMLQIVGLSKDGLGIQIRYRLVEAQKTRLAAA